MDPLLLKMILCIVSQMNTWTPLRIKQFSEKVEPLIHQELIEETAIRAIYTEYYNDEYHQ